MSNLQNIIAENEKLFDSQFPNLNDSTKDGGYDARSYVKEFNRKSTLRLIEGFREMVREVFYDFNDKEQDFECNQKVLKLRNALLSELGSINEIK